MNQEAEIEKLSVVFTGDICFTGTFKERLVKGLPVFDELLNQLFRNAGFTVGNLEGAETEMGESRKKGAVLKNPPGVISFLHQHNIRVLNLANNHIMDYGETGLRDTINAAKKTGSVYLGAGENIEQASVPVYLEKNGIRVAIIACAHKEGMMAGKETPGVLYAKEFDIIIQRIREARSRSNHIVLIYHGGAEFIRYPIPSKQKLLKRLMDCGADVIIGHHPHVSQPIRRFGQKVIFYSLGNFIFDKPSFDNYSHTNRGSLVKIEFSSSSYQTSVLECASSNGILNIVPADESFFFNTFSTRDFRRDADRVWRERKASIKKAKKERTVSSGNQSGPLKKLRHYVNMLTDESTSPLIKGAILYRLKKKTGLK